MAEPLREPTLFPDHTPGDGSGAPDTPDEMLPGSHEIPVVSAPRVERTWSVAELHRELSDLLSGHFGERTWVTGEMRSLKRSPKGHTYFELVEPDSDGDYNAPKLSVTLFAGRRRKVNAQIAETGGRVGFQDGTVVRICGEVSTYAARSSLQLLMTGIDPAYTLGAISQRRELVLASLRAENLLEANAALEVPWPPVRLAVVTSTGSAAAADTLHELEVAGIGFHVSLVDARTQGAEAEGMLVAALRTAESLEVDVVLLVRGGGSATDLAVFDSEALARAIAALEVPVFSGIGHETDRTVADEVAHSSHKTPTAAAAAVTAMAHEAQRKLADSTASVSTAALGTLARRERDLAEATRRTSFAHRSHVEREDRLLTARLERIAASAPLAVGRVEHRLDSLAQRITAASRPALMRSNQSLEALASVVRAHDPARMMERGWSLTHDAHGNLVRSVADLDPGDELLTTLADGTVASTVSERDPGPHAPPTTGSPSRAQPPER